jgi:YHS domain-containing protein
MKTTHRSKQSSFLLTLAAGLAISVAAPAAFAQHSHGDDKPGQHGHKDDGHSHGEVAKAGSFADAAQRIAADVQAMDAALAGGSVAGVSDKANAVATLAKTMGALALAKESGVPREKVKEINAASKELAEAADNLHNIADAGDLAKSKAAFAPVKAAAAKVAALAPAMAEGHDHAHGAEAAAVTHTVTVAAEGGKTIEAGKAVPMVFTLKNAKGAPVKDLDTVHEKVLHLLAVSKDLSWFAHEHPTRRADGTFTMPMTFPAGGEYTLYFDFTPKGSSQQVVPVKVTATGTPKAAVPLSVDADKPKTIDGFTVALDTEGAIKAGGNAHMSFNITKDGKPVSTLRPYLGAMGHMVIISEDGTQFVHAHPHEGGEHGVGHGDGHGAGGHDAHGGHGGHGDAAKKDGHTGGAGHGAGDGHDAKAAAQAGGPKVDFEAHFKQPGTYKAWAQFNVGTAEKERVLTVPFTFTVEKGAVSAAPVNKICPMTGDVVNAFHTRDFKGQTVGFCDGDCALRWDGLKDEERMAKLVAAIAGSTPKTPHGAQPGAGHSGADHAGGDDAMPAGVDADEERALYLTPGGIYTEADIKANGSVTAGDKYKGKMAKHDMKPKAGDKVCPITMTKANPKFTWIIGGKTYEFCCPPCIDEYVLLAKTSPKEVLDPSEYIKK